MNTTHKNNESASLVLDSNMLETLADYIESRQQIILSTEDTQYSFLTYITKIEKNNFHLHNSIPSAIIKQAMGSKNIFMTLPGLGFKCARMLTDGKYLILEPQEIIDFSETREEERIPFQQGEKVSILVTNPYDKRTTILKEVLDISTSGLSFENHFNSKLFTAGEYLKNIEILINGATVKTADAKVVYNRKLFDAEYRQRYQIGLSLENIQEK